MIKKSIIIAALPFCLVSFTNSSPTSVPPITANVGRAEIEKVLSTYEHGINTSNLKEVTEVYTSNAELLPQGAPTSAGIANIGAFYAAGFKAIQLNIKFRIEQIMISGKFAFARTESQGTILDHASGKTIPESNRELFIFQKQNGVWKISKYMFNMAK